MLRLSCYAATFWCVGFTATAATLSLCLITAANAKARADFHMRELHKAICDMYPQYSRELIFQPCRS
jgi:hypothetical protein